MKSLSISLWLLSPLLSATIWAKPVPITTESVEIAKQAQNQVSTEYTKYQNLLTFFQKHKCPEPFYIDDYLHAAQRYQIDYRLLPAIGLQESTCNQHYPRCTNNPFGYGSATSLRRFDSIPAAIDYVSQQLATAHPYAGKTITQKLQAYGPHPDGTPSPTYYKQVTGWMKEISNDILQ